VTVSKQLKVENELKFVYPGSGRKFKCNLEVLEFLENAAKAIESQAIEIKSPSYWAEIPS